MYRKRLYIVIITIILLYFLSKAISRIINCPYFFNHFTDFLFVPFLCFLDYTEHRLLKINRGIKIEVWQTIVIVVFVLFYFEWYFPNYVTQKELYSADIIDSLMYGMGDVVFLIIQNRLLRVTSISSQID